MMDIEQAKAKWEDIRADPDTAIRRMKWAVWANTTGLTLINEVAALRHDITRQMDIANEHVNEAASLRKQLEDARSEALEEAACIADSLAETYAEPTQRDYDRRDGAIEAATFIRKLKGKS